MFSLNLFIKNGLLKAIGKMADYQIILNAAGWLDKNVLSESDLAEIQAAIEAHNTQHETSNGIVEESVDDATETREDVADVNQAT